MIITTRAAQSNPEPIFKRSSLSRLMIAELFQKLTPFEILIFHNRYYFQLYGRQWQAHIHLNEIGIGLGVL